MAAPSTNGRSTKGQFLPGNPGGPGNPHAGRVQKLRSALLNAVTEQDVSAVAAALVAAAKSGDVPAIKLLFDRVLGKVDTFRLDDETAEQAQNANRVLDMLNLVKAERDRRVAKNAE
jgi:hypothetical protein